MDVVFHYPPELLQLLVDTIPRLSRSKEDQITFFRGAGVLNRLTVDLADRVRRDRNGINRYEIARTVLSRLNECGDEGLRARREILRRVTEFEDFSRCWPKEAMEARGLVAQVRELVNVKDSFTRMRQERDEEAIRRRRERSAAQETAARRSEEVVQIRDEMARLYGETNPHRRGKALEGVLARMFAHYGMLVREAFELTGPGGEGVVEQIDGAVLLDGDLFLVEVKWWSQPLGPMETAQHLSRVFARADCRGIMISASGFTPAAINAYRDALRSRTLILCKLEELLFALERGDDVAELFRRKVRAAILDRQPLSEQTE